MRRVLIFGKGRSGTAAAELLTRAGDAVTILEGTDAWPEGDFDFAVTSPGIAPNHVWRQTAAARGVPVISELQLGVEHLKAAGVKMLAVTGSKGKSSVVKLCAAALGGVPCGNYGKPVCEVANEGTKGWAVVEVSSFQLETTNLPKGTFEAAAVLNLQEDHLDRHGTVAAYHALKLKLLTMAREGILGDETAAPQAEDALFAGSYFDNGVLRANGRVAVKLLYSARLSPAAITEAFRTFEPLPHRFQTILVENGVRWIDDSKATSLAALGAGVRMAGENCRLIAGGLPKGDNPLSLISLLHFRVKKVYLIGVSADCLYEAWGRDVPCERCGTLARAVAAARRDACPGESVLLSPGAASFDQFKSYGERGDTFAALAKKKEE